MDEKLKKVSFTAYGGEILGIAGIAGSGQRELLESIAGLQQTDPGSNIIVFAQRVIQCSICHCGHNRIGIRIPVAGDVYRVHERTSARLMPLLYHRSRRLSRPFAGMADRCGLIGISPGGQSFSRTASHLFWRGPNAQYALKDSEK